MPRSKLVRLARQQGQAKAEQPAAKDERSETVKALLRDSQEEAQRKATERKPAPEPVPAK